MSLTGGLDLCGSRGMADGDINDDFLLIHDDEETRSLLIGSGEVGWFNTWAPASSCPRSDGLFEEVVSVVECGASHV